MWHHSEILTSWLDNEAEFKVAWELGYEKNDQNVEKSPQYLLWQLFTNVRRHVKISEGTTLKLLADTSIQKTGGPSKVNRYDVGKLFEFLGTFDLDPNQWVKIEYKLALSFFSILENLRLQQYFNLKEVRAAIEDNEGVVAKNKKGRSLMTLIPELRHKASAKKSLVELLREMDFDLDPTVSSKKSEMKDDIPPEYIMALAMYELQRLKLDMSVLRHLYDLKKANGKEATDFGVDQYLSSLRAEDTRRFHESSNAWMNMKTSADDWKKDAFLQYFTGSDRPSFE